MGKQGLQGQWAPLGEIALRCCRQFCEFVDSNTMTISTLLWLVGLKMRPLKIQRSWAM